MEWPKISIKWKIFSWCFALALMILGSNYWYTTKLVRRSAGHTSTELQAYFTRYQAFERAVAQGMSAAVDVWAGSPQLRNAFAAGNDEAAKPVLASTATVTPPRSAPSRRGRRGRCARSAICARA